MSTSISVFGLHGSGNFGQIFANGEIRDHTGMQRGKIGVDGTLRDQRGQLIGNIYQNGQFRNAEGASAEIFISSRGDIRVRNEHIGRVQMAWGMKIPDHCIAYAAAYLLNKPQGVWG